MAAAEEARTKLLRVTPVPTVVRPEIPVPALLLLERKPITKEQVAAVPRVAPREGILLGPGGWTKLWITATPEAPAGTVKILLEIEVGNRIIEKVVEITIKW